MDRRAFLWWGIPSAWAALFAGPGQAAPLDADTIKAALKTATPEEEGFIEYVLALVAEERLPPSLVESTFQWARKKSRHRFQYFKRALLIRAARLGIEI